MATKYEYQAQRIVEVFAAHHIAARVWQVTTSPQFSTFRCTFALSARLNKVKALDDELKVALGVPFVRIVEDGGAVNIEVPRDGATRLIDITDVLIRLPAAPAYTAVIGVDGANVPLLLRMDSPDVAHCLISGTTGSGKTVLLRTLLLSLALLNQPGCVQIALIDPKGQHGKLMPLAALPHIWRQIGLISEPADAALLLAALVAEMERRDRAGRRAPRLIIAIDELADLLQSGGDAISEPLQRLTQRGREAGLHVIAATQRPAATLVGGMVKANFPVRLIGSVTSVEDAKVAAGIGGTGAERLLGRGDFLVVAKGQVIRFQVAAVADRSVAALVTAAGTGQGRRRRSWTETEIGQALAAVRNDTPRNREARELRAALADLAVEQGARWPGDTPAQQSYGPVQQGRALVHYSPTDAEHAAVTASLPSVEVVHRGALVQTGADASGADITPTRGVLPRRPDGPSAEDITLLRSAHASLGSLNKTIEWAYGSKGPLTLHWVKLALRERPVTTLTQGEPA